MSGTSKHNPKARPGGSAGRAGGGTNRNGGGRDSSDQTTETGTKSPARSNSTPAVAAGANAAIAGFRDVTANNLHVQHQHGVSVTLEDLRAGWAAAAAAQRELEALRLQRMRTWFAVGFLIIAAAAALAILYSAPARGAKKPVPRASDVIPPPEPLPLEFVVPEPAPLPLETIPSIVPLPLEAPLPASPWIRTDSVVLPNAHVFKPASADTATDACVKRFAAAWDDFLTNRDSERYVPLQFSMLQLLPDKLIADRMEFFNFVFASGDRDRNAHSLKNETVWFPAHALLHLWLKDSHANAFVYGFAAQLERRHAIIQCPSASTVFVHVRPNRWKPQHKWSFYAGSEYSHTIEIDERYKPVVVSG